MVVVFLLAILGAGAFMLAALRRLAIRHQESPGPWTLGLVMVWAFIWVVSQAIRRVLGSEESLLFQRFHPWVVACALVLSFGTFALFWYFLDQRTQDRYFEERVGEIGQTEEEESSSDSRPH